MVQVKWKVEKRVWLKNSLHIIKHEPVALKCVISKHILSYYVRPNLPKKYSIVMLTISGWM